MSRIAIKALKDLAKKYGLDHVIVFATSGKTQHVATYGRTVEECGQAADFGNKMRDALGWPHELLAQPSRVKRLLKRIKDLETTLADLGYSARDVEQMIKLKGHEKEGDRG